MRQLRQAIKNWTTRIALCLIAAAVAGCGGGSVPVEGRVTLDDKPLANATVMLSPVRGTGPGPFTGTTDAEGRFALKDTDKQGGPVPGEYMLMIATVMTDPNADEMTPPPTQREVVPSRWRNGTEKFTVPDGGIKDANFAMKSR
jgi:hypothetical protein